METYLPTAKLPTTFQTLDLTGFEFDANNTQESTEKWWMQPVPHFRKTV
jgi:hypothetical protein